ncbi:heat stress transcription factor B-4b-like [Aristolochia californica]|uniref:heat stress transcription factor B-4b-like n=1 Tax=Aristolochia californica TaxID=171875 RepID=UPI0035DF92C6
MAFLVERCGEMVVSVDSHKAIPAPFLTKTYQLVDDPCSDHIVSWGEDEATFVVWRPPEFARDLLPNYFKHNNFSSFVRQLNTYGFRKIVADRWEFANEFFRKGEKHLLCEIQRRKSPHIPPQLHYSDSPKFPASDEMGYWFESPLPSPISEAEFLSALTEDNQRLRRRNSLLLSELSHMKKLYNDIIYFLQNHVTPVPREPRIVNQGPKFIELSPNHQDHSLLAPQALKNHGTMTFAEESNSTVMLFGVPLHHHGKKRLHPETLIPLEE